MVSSLAQSVFVSPEIRQQPPICQYTAGVCLEYTYFQDFGQVVSTCWDFSRDFIAELNEKDHLGFPDGGAGDTCGATAASAWPLGPVGGSYQPR